MMKPIEHNKRLVNQDALDAFDRALDVQIHLCEHPTFVWERYLTPETPLVRYPLGALDVLTGDDLA